MTKPVNSVLRNLQKDILAEKIKDAICSGRLLPDALRAFYYTWWNHDIAEEQLAILVDIIMEEK